MAATSFSARRPQGPESKLLDWLNSIEDEGNYWRGRALRDADKYERIFLGGRRMSADSRTPHFRASVVGPTVRRRNALLTENKPVFKVEPLIEGMQATGAILNNLAEFAWQDHGFGGAIEEMVDLASVFGACGMSLPFDFAADGGTGSVRAAVRDPRSVIIDPGIISAADVGSRAKYTMIETVESIWDLQHDFPGRGMEVKPDLGVSGVIRSPLGRGIQTSDNQGSVSYRDRIKKLQEGPIPRARKKVYFVRDPALRPTGELKFPFGRMIVRAGDIILADEPSPFFDSEPDLVWFENRREFGSLWGSSEVEALRYLQGAINRIGEMFVNNTVLMGNSRVIADSDALSNEALNNLTNAEALVITKKRMSSLDWQPPTPMPPHFLQFITFARQLVDYLIGLSDSPQAGGRQEVRSGVQLEGLQSAAQVLIRAMARRLEEFIERLGRKFISRVFQFYNQDRILLATGPGGQFQKYQFETKKLFEELQEISAREAGESGNFDEIYKRRIRNAGASFAFRVQPLSSLATTKAARAQMLMQLVEAVMLPRNIVLREVGFDNADEMINLAKAEAAQMKDIMPPSSGNKKKKPAGAAA